MTFEVFQRPLTRRGRLADGETLPALVSVPPSAFHIRFNRTAAELSGLEDGEEAHMLLDRSMMVVAVKVVPAGSDGWKICAERTGGALYIRCGAFLKNICQVPYGSYRLEFFEYGGFKVPGFSFDR